MSRRLSRKSTFSRVLESRRVVFVPAKMLPLEPMWHMRPFSIGLLFRLIPYLVSHDGLTVDLLFSVSGVSLHMFDKHWPDIKHHLRESAPGRFVMAETEWLRVQVIRGSVQQHFDRLIEFWGAACVYCGDAESDLEIDHIIPVARGGSSDVGNLTLACRRCNGQKRARTAAEFGHPHIHEQAKGIQ